MPDQAHLNRTTRIFMLGAAPSAMPQQGGDRQAAQDPQDAMTRKLLARLDLEKYKATIKGLAQFGDRRQGTERNRKAVDWIEAQLRSYGCPTERVRYVYDAPARAPRPAKADALRAGDRERRGTPRPRGLALPRHPAARGTSRSTCTRRSRTRTSGWALTPRRRRAARSACWPGCRQ